MICLPSARRRARRSRTRREARQCLAGGGRAASPWSWPSSPRPRRRVRPARSRRSVRPEGSRCSWDGCPERVGSAAVTAAHWGSRPRAWRHAEIAAASSMRVRAAWRSASAASASMRSRVGRSVSPSRNDLSKKPRDSRASWARRSAAASCVRAASYPHRAASRSAARRARSSSSCACDFGRPRRARWHCGRRGADRRRRGCARRP